VGLLGKGGFMSNIENDVKAAIEEFGECAFERFWYPLGEDSFLVQDNEMLISILQDEKYCTDLELLPLPELFAHGVKFNGNGEYLMWEIFDNYINKPKEWHTPSSNKELDYYLSYHLEDEIIRRKTSATRPFDLERAKAGDVVEVLHDGEWIVFDFKRWLLSGDTGIDNISFQYPADLRMKFQKKVQS